MFSDINLAKKDTHQCIRAYLFSNYFNHLGMEHSKMYDYLLDLKCRIINILKIWLSKTTFSIKQHLFWTVKTSQILNSHKSFQPDTNFEKVIFIIALLGIIIILYLLPFVILGGAM